MKTKLIAISLAGILSTESLAFAQPPSRVGDIGDAQIYQALKQVAELKKNLLTLDLSLAQAEVQILKQESTDKVARTIVIANAAIATGLSLLTFNKMTTLKAVGTGLGVSTAIATGISAIAKAIANAQNGSVDLSSTVNDLTILRSQVVAGIAADKGENKELEEFILSLEKLDKTLQIYKSEKSEDSLLQMKSIVAQSVGLSLAALSLSTSKSPGVIATAYIGNLVLIVGNVMPLLGFSDGAHPEELLIVIAGIRNSIKETVKTL